MFIRNLETSPPGSELVLETRSALSLLVLLLELNSLVGAEAEEEELRLGKVGVESLEQQSEERDLTDTWAQQISRDRKKILMVTFDEW